MRPTQSLPETYRQDGILDLSKDKRLMLMLNLVGMVVFLLSWVVFLNLAGSLRGEDEFSIIFNFAGSIGDVAIVIWLLRKPRTVYINDFGDGVITYYYGKNRE